MTKHASTLLTKDASPLLKQTIKDRKKKKKKKVLNVRPIYSTTRPISNGIMTSNIMQIVVKILEKILQRHWYKNNFEHYSELKVTINKLEQYNCSKHVQLSKY